MYQGNKQYIAFFKAFSRCHSDNSQQTNQFRANELWKTVKAPNEPIDMDLYKKVIQDLNQKSDAKEERKKIFTNFFRVPQQKKVNPVGVNPAKEPVEPDVEVVAENDDEDENMEAISKSTPAQEKLEVEIKSVQADIEKLKDAKALGFNEESVASMSKRIKELEKNKEELEKKLKKKKQDQKNQMTFRKKRKEALEKVEKEHPDIAAKLKPHKTDKVGRPRIESDQPNLLRDVLEIATIGAACSEKRRDDLFRTVKTLDDLHSAISDLGYNLSRTALYYRLLPKSSSSVAGRRHVKTVPVRLVRYVATYLI